LLFFFFKQKTAYEIPKRDWSSDVCSSDLGIYYLAANSQTAATINSYTSQLTLYTPAMPQTNGASTGSSIIFYSQTGVTGAFATAASLTGLSTQNNISPIVRLA